MAHVTLTLVAKFAEGESVLGHGVLGGSPPHSVVSQCSSARHGVLDGKKFDVIIDPVGGTVRSQSSALMKPGTRGGYRVFVA